MPKFSNRFFFVTTFWLLRKSWSQKIRNLKSKLYKKSMFNPKFKVIFILLRQSDPIKADLD
jgi:hypothetical protein